MTHSPRQMCAFSRQGSALAAVVLLLGGGLSCERSSGDWNTVFQRKQGWMYADGGCSAELSDGKTVWLFGDSIVKADRGMLYNTIAVQDTEPGRVPLPNELRFFARTEREELVDVSTRATGGLRPWLDPSAVHGQATETWMWPTDAIAESGPLIAFYSEIGCVRGEYPACRSYLGNLGFVGHAVQVVDNPTDDPSSWRMRVTPLRDRNGRTPAEQRLHWGSSLLEDGGWLYVFGTALGENAEPGDVKLARVLPGNVARYELWQFLGPDGWRMLPTGPTPADLQSVAPGGAAELSVDRVERNGEPWFVMVQVDVFTQEVVVRTAKGNDPGAIRFASPKAGPDARRLSLPELDPGSAGGHNWSGRAQRRRSPSRSPSEHSLLVSYFSSRAASLRFVEIPLSSVRDSW